MNASKPDARLAALEQRLGYRFNNQALLREAMTHGSVLGGRNRNVRSYERLEFLGDRVLGLIVAARLYKQHPEDQEDALAPRFNALVDKHACAAAARAAGLGEALILSSSEETNGGRAKEAILADVCESVIAALYLDGGMDAARDFIFEFWGDAFEDVKIAPRDAKTALQEWAASQKKGLSYVVIDRKGPEHDPVFTIEARVDGFKPTKGEGGSKREAQRAAALAFLKARGAND